MVYTARELLVKLNNLQIVGVEDGEILWLGDDKQWEQVQLLEKERRNIY